MKKFLTLLSTLVLFFITLPAVAGVDHSFALQSAQIISTSNVFGEAVGVKTPGAGIWKTGKIGNFANNEINDKSLTKTDNSFQALYRSVTKPTKWKNETWRIAMTSTNGNTQYNRFDRQLQNFKYLRS